MESSELMPWERVGPKYKKSYQRAGMLVDLDRCIGCHSCSVSCKTENEVPLGNFRMRVRYLEQPDNKQITFTPLICMHCVDAPCMKACPFKAIKKGDDGRILINENRCDLEQEFVKACPYGAISINVEKEVAEKCDFCQHRTDVGLEPACVDNCPTDALVFGDLDDPESRISRLVEKRQAKPWKPEAKATPTICFSCTNHCGVIGWVQDGIVRKIEGNPLDPNSEGNICSKAQGMISYTYYPERILYPLKRVGKRGEGKWKRISWDEAYDELVSKLKPLRENGVPEEFIFHYGRDKTKGVTKHFTNAFGTPHRLNRRSICSSNRRAPLMSFYGREFEWESQDLENTTYVVNFGANPYEAYQGGLFMVHRLQKARVEKGAKLVTFEVRPSNTASKSDEFFSIMPGTDGAVAGAMIHTILKEGLEDKTFWKKWSNYDLEDLRKQVSDYTPEWAETQSGVPAAEIERIAIEFAKAAPACCTMSNRGSAKHYNGMQADRLIRTLDVLVGNVGKPGGYCLSTLRGWAGRYGQEGLPKLSLPEPQPSDPTPWGLGEEGVMGSFKNHVRFLKGMHQRVVMCSHHVGHWEHGIVGTANTEKTSPEVGEDKALTDQDLKKGVWWSKKNGGIGGGVHINDALPINPAPLIGGQNWYDNVCKIEKLV